VFVFLTLRGAWGGEALWRQAEAAPVIRTPE
jgi:hypothetical protein